MLATLICLVAPFQTFGWLPTTLFTIVVGLPTLEPACQRGLLLALKIAFFLSLKSITLSWKMEEDGWQSKDNHLPDLWTTRTLCCASVHEAMTLYQRFQTEVEEDILNRFKMLDISNRFKIWDFKSILNVDLWLHSCTASNPPSLLWELQRYRTLCASVHEAMPLYQRWSLVSDRSGGR